MAQDIIMGVDVGATGFKGGLVDIKKGEMVSERFRLETPAPATPKAMAKTFKELVKHFDYEGPVGLGFPAIVHNGVSRSASNIDKAWIGTSIVKTFGKDFKGSIHALNDADAAGIAEMEFGAGRKYQRGTTIMITIGTGLGAALFRHNELVPNMEFGSMYLKDMKKIAEKYVSNRVRKDQDMSWKDFGKRFNEYLLHIERIFSPDCILLGGGASKSFTEYEKYLEVEATILPAKLLNKAGTVGAALYAYQQAQ
ncbi:MAG: ROK family protein [Bacteroidota bacterium]